MEPLKGINKKTLFYSANTHALCSAILLSMDKSSIMRITNKSYSDENLKEVIKDLTKASLKIVEDEQNSEKSIESEIGYLDLAKDILTYPTRNTRNCVTRSSFDRSLKFDLRAGFPLLTTKKMFFRGIVEELLFFLRGDTNTTLLSEKGIKIWEGNTSRDFLDSVGLEKYEVGDMGPSYGFNWRHHGAEYEGMKKCYDSEGMDQLKNVLKLLKEDPTSRRIMMTTYDPSTVDRCVLPPCHGLLTQFYVDEGKFLDCRMDQRSADVALGVPFDIASYAMLMIIVGEVTGYTPRHLTIHMGDVHVYEPHVSNMKEQIKRDPYKSPVLKLNKKYEGSTVEDALTYIETLKYEDFDLCGYEHHGSIKYEMF